MGTRRETLAFALAAAGCITAFFHEALLGGKVLSPADVLLVQRSFGRAQGADPEPLNRLLMDPVLQFQPWLEFNRAQLRQGRLPLWNPYAGCGAPHLANGQSAVFDPVHLLAYLGTVPAALGPMAALRLWIAALGSFLLARWWGLGPWGRWFAGLTYPFCGFLVVWLLYPVTPVAIWLPWVVLATDRALAAPGRRSAGALGLTVGLAILGGHVQTGAHVLMLSGLLVCWRCRRRASLRLAWRPGLLAWTAGISLGLCLAAVQIVPLGFYLSRSPVWTDRRMEKPAWWTLSRPRLLDMACTALPYAYGSQRRGHPNLARGLGVHNLNESAGGYAGLATLVWLAPLALRQTRRRPEIAFLAAVTAVGAMGAFRLPPVDNVLRCLPVIDVTDNRRLTLWVAFGLCLLGAFGLDSLARGERPARSWITLWLAAAAILAAVAFSVPRLEPLLRRRAEQHYRTAQGDPLDAAVPVGERRAERQLRAALNFIPRYYGLAACELAVLALLGLAARRGAVATPALPAALLGLTLLDLAGFGVGLNPAISPAVQRLEPPLIARLRQGLGPGQRALGIGEELPPNTLMRFGLSDPRNYDSVELARSLRWFAPLYEPGPEALTSRRAITWDGVLRARPALTEAGVAAIVGATAPPPDRFARVDRAGDVWIAWLEPARWASAGPTASLELLRREAGGAVLRVRAAAAVQVAILETWDPGWRAWIDGAPASLETHKDAFINIDVPGGIHTLILEYRPAEVSWALAASAFGALAAILALTGSARS